MQQECPPTCTHCIFCRYQDGVYIYDKDNNAHGPVWGHAVSRDLVKVPRGAVLVLVSVCSTRCWD